MDESERNLITRFCFAERLKSTTLNMMQTILRFQDYIENKKEEPDGKTILLWVLNLLNNEVTQAASISQNKFFIEAQNLVAEAIQLIGGQQPNFQQIIDKLREAVTRITSEASNVAKELKF